MWNANSWRNVQTSAPPTPPFRVWSSLSPLFRREDREPWSQHVLRPWHRIPLASISPWSCSRNCLRSRRGWRSVESSSHRVINDLTDDYWRVDFWESFFQDSGALPSALKDKTRILQKVIILWPISWVPVLWHSLHLSGLQALQADFEVKAYS